jgi:pimeloyl-ACP methyl ester carboxylesterase
VLATQISTTELIAIAAAAVAVIAFGAAIALAIALRRLRRAQRLVLGDHGERDLVAHAVDLHEAFAALREYLEDVGQRLDGRLSTAERRLDGAVTHRALVRYDAYNEMSGHQSLSIALLDANRSGIVLSSIHHRDSARLYAKQVNAGAAEQLLSPEEEEALRLALTPEG